MALIFIKMAWWMIDEKKKKRKKLERERRDIIY
jgi:hypothetical protein